MTKKITLWTIQHSSFYERLKREKQIYIFSKDYLYRRELHGYGWLKNIMKTRLGEPPFKKSMPIWAWYQWQSENKKRPDLRFSGYFEKGTHAVRLEIEKNLDDILLSDFILWHYPYCFKDYIPHNENDELKMKTLINNLNLQNTEFFHYPEHIKSMIEKSWDQIFDLDFRNLKYTHTIDQKSIQATFWSLHMDEVIKVDEFIAR